jgi:uncharacterized protein with PIN domain
MCIVIYKGKGVNLPDKKIIKNCMVNNPDGTGYMFPVSDGVLIRKGFNDVNLLLKALHSDLKTYGLKENDIDIALHMRIATAGKVKPENCHPFPITDHIGDLQSTFIISDKAMVHNGMINICDDNFKNLSDTQIFVKDILCKLNLKHRAVKKLINLSIGSSKLLFFDKTGMFDSYGKWIEDNKIFYSNDSYKERVYNFDKWDKWNDFPGYKKDKNMCVFCDSKLNKKNTAELSEIERNLIGLYEDENICNDCMALYGRENLF